MCFKMAEDGVPPLEDMSEMLSKVQEIKSKKAVTEVKTSAITHLQQRDTSCATSHSKNKKTNSDSSGFGELKKGFLFAEKKAPSKVSRNDDIEFVKPKQTQNNANKIPEVQAAMQANELLTKNTDWVTPDLLRQIEGNDVLMKQFSDPLFMEAISDFQKNPTQASDKYSGNTEVMTFLKEFCSLMGQHFSTISPQDASKTTKTEPVIETRPKEEPFIKEHNEEEEKVAAVLDDPEMKAILMDKEVVKFLDLVKEQPMKAQYVLQTASPSLQQKIRRMMEAGLLGVQKDVSV